jgi:hypothetical protein
MLLAEADWDNGKKQEQVLKTKTFCLSW